MIEKDAVIIGAGPAGLFTGANIDGRNISTTILEKNSSPGKKLLISGGGQCNITHTGTTDDFLNKYGKKGRFLKSSLHNFTNKDTIEFFKKRKVKLVVDDNGKFFPESKNSEDILNILLKEIKNNNIDLRYNENVQDIEYIKEEERFIIITDNNKYKTKILVLTTGGKSYPNTGSTGDGYEFAKKLGHSIINTKPALTPIYIKDYKFKDLAGISLEVEISLWRNNKKIEETSGSLLFTHVNLSGPVILNFSRYVDPNDIIKINYLKDKNFNNYNKEIAEILQNYGAKQIKTFISELDIPTRLGEKILEISKISEDIKCAEITKKQRKRLVENLMEMNLTVDRLGDYHLAMVTTGGVDLAEINRKTMESKLIKNLYLAGEVMDIDGDTGGYNIQWAFSSGYATAKSINKG